jgi:hypothetical protein
MKELVRMKDQMVADYITPAYFLKASAVCSCCPC